MTNMFNYVNDTINTCKCLRAYKQNKLQIPLGIHKMVFVNGFAYNSVNIWNHISLEVRKCHNLSSFKAGYLRHHFNALN